MTEPTLPSGPAVDGNDGGSSSKPPSAPEGKRFLPPPAPSSNSGLLTATNRSTSLAAMSGEVPATSGLLLPIREEVSGGGLAAAGVEEREEAGGIDVSFSVVVRLGRIFV
jgi:hypothetical protein